LTRFLLDTSIVSAAMWKTPDAGVLERLGEHGGECAISAHVWHELRYGVARLPRGRRREVLEAFLRDVVHPTLPTVATTERPEFTQFTRRVREHLNTLSLIE
jgi:predicted nucleic acid-binding protein